MCRGNGGQHVFGDKKDNEAFLKRLGAVAAAFHVEIHAYALMARAGTKRGRWRCGLRGNGVERRQRCAR